MFGTKFGLWFSIPFLVCSAFIALSLMVHPGFWFLSVISGMVFWGMNLGSGNSITFGGLNIECSNHRYDRNPLLIRKNKVLLEVLKNLNVEDADFIDKAEGASLTWTSPITGNIIRLEIKIQEKTVSRRRTTTIFFDLNINGQSYALSDGDLFLIIKTLNRRKTGPHAVKDGTKVKSVIDSMREEMARAKEEKMLRDFAEMSEKLRQFKINVPASHIDPAVPTAKEIQNST